MDAFRSRECDPRNCHFLSFLFKLFTAAVTGPLPFELVIGAPQWPQAEVLRDMVGVLSAERVNDEKKPERKPKPVEGEGSGVWLALELS